MISKILINTLLICSMGGPSIAAEQRLSKEQLMQQFREAHESSDYRKIEQLINWNGVSGYQKKMVRVYTKANFGRKIAHSDFRPADTAYLRNFSLGPKTYHSNMEVSHLMRFEFDERIAHDKERPSVVYLVGQVDGEYRIAMTTRKSEGR